MPHVTLVTLQQREALQSSRLKSNLIRRLRVLRALIVNKLGSRQEKRATSTLQVAQQSKPVTYNLLFK